MENNYEMIAAVIGNGEVEMDALDALLDWFLPDDCRLELSTNDPGVEIVRQWCEEVGQEYSFERTSEYMIESLMSWQDQDYNVALIVLGVENNERFVYAAWNAGIEVYDLTRAMYPVTRGDDLDLVVYEPETLPHEISDGLGSRGSLDIFAPQDGSQSREGPHLDTGTLLLVNAEGLRNMMMGVVQAHEKQYHQPAVIVAELTEEELNQQGIHNDGVDDPSKDKIRCLKNKKTGAVRVSPRAQPKSNEEEIWLSQEEVDAL